MFAPDFILRCLSWLGECQFAVEHDLELLASQFHHEGMPHAGRDGKLLGPRVEKLAVPYSLRLQFCGFRRVFRVQDIVVSSGDAISADVQAGDIEGPRKFSSVK